jgi:hypothetical protein
MINEGLFTSDSGEWETPHDLFDKLWDEFGGFDLDPCGRPEHHTVKRILQAGGTYFSPAVNGLACLWHDKVYLNPPYGREIGKWVEKAVGEVENGNAELVVALLPARVDTKWWQGNVIQGVRWDRHQKHLWALAPMKPDYVRFLPGRLRFVGATNSAPFPSAVVVWRR